MKIGSGNKISGLDNYSESEHKYYGLIQSWKEKCVGNPFKHNENLFLELCRQVGFERFDKETQTERKREISIANLNKRNDVKPLPIWTARKITIQKPESQAIKNCILELGRKVERFTRAEAKEACKGIISDTDSIDSVLHSQIIYMLNHGLIKTVAKGLKETLKNGKKKINYYALA
jgi:hypothetical protein